MAKRHLEQVAMEPEVSVPAETSKSEIGAPVATAALPFVPKIIKTVVRPTLKLTVDNPIYVKVTSKIFTGKEIKGGKGDENRKPAEIADVIDLATGEEMQIVCGALVVSGLNETYPDDSYVGKCFMIVKNPKTEGKNYFTYKINEIENPQG